MEYTLVIMAAGMGSRFGGLKQIESVDSYGHILIDYAIYDAIRAGFRRVVFIIKKEIEVDFKKIIEPRKEKWGIKVDYVFQELDDLPNGFRIPEGRKKPWGTAHAVACLDGIVDSPFAVINADDYYGRSAFERIIEFFTHNSKDCAMVGYLLKNTLSKNGSVSRGVCRAEGEYLADICEIGGITEHGGKNISEWQGAYTELNLDSIVSMNFWGFRPAIISECKSFFTHFLSFSLQKEPLSCEFYLPSVISRLIAEGGLRVKVIESKDKWHGITYRQDRENLSAALDELIEKGVYPKSI